MSRRSLGVRVFVGGLVGLAFLAVAVPAHAVLAGENGRIRVRQRSRSSTRRR